MFKNIFLKEVFYLIRKVEISDKPMGVFGDCVPVNGKVICGSISYQNGIRDVKWKKKI